MANTIVLEENYIKEDRGYKTKCWIWQGYINKKGYGQCWPKTHLGEYYVHRWMYKKYKGKIPKGKEPDHLCNIKACCNPSHLEAVTRKVHVTRTYTRDPDIGKRIYQRHPHIRKNQRVLTRKQVQKIFKLRLLGLSYSKIAQKLTIRSAETVRFVCLGKTYTYWSGVSTV